MIIEADALLKGTFSAHCRFEKSDVWQDFVDDIQMQLTQARMGYNNCNDLRELGELQGIEKALESVLGMPFRFIDALKDLATTEELEEFSDADDNQ